MGRDQDQEWGGLLGYHGGRNGEVGWGEGGGGGEEF